MPINEARARMAARLHLEQGLSNKEIGEKYLKCSERTARDHVHYARHNNLVSIRVEYVFNSPPETITELGDELADLAGLEEACVLRHDEAFSESSGDDGALELHYQLGRVAADYAYPRIRRSVAIGAGRGVAYTIRALRDLVTERRRSRLRDLEIFSVVGAMWVRTYSLREISRDYVDADQNALELAALLGIAWPQVHLVWLPRLWIERAPQDKGEMIARIAPHLGGNDWTAHTQEGARDVGLALFGLGVVNEKGHYLLRQSGPQTAAVAELEALKREILPKYPTALVDVCDRFWVREVGLPDDVRVRTQEIVDSLNEKSIAVSFAKLNAASNRVLVAGGANKIDGVEEVLRNGEKIGIQPDVLVTDQRTAEELIKRFEASPIAR